MAGVSSPSFCASYPSASPATPGRCSEKMRSVARSASSRRRRCGGEATCSSRVSSPRAACARFVCPVTKMKESARSVVARFFKVPESDVTDSFVLPPERLQGSISRRVLHAALKRLADADLPGVWTASTFGELLSGGGATNIAPAPAAAIPLRSSSTYNGAPAVGIDIEQVSQLPWSGDPWSEAFYSENFTRSETAHAMRQPHPRRTLCGMWCAKEAAIKCGPELAGLRPAQIEVLHDESGRPRLAVEGADIACEISISHTDSTAVAVCIPHPAQPGPQAPP